MLAGVTVAAFLVPQVMAYARVAGVPPVARLVGGLPALALVLIDALASTADHWSRRAAHRTGHPAD
jgi:MFS superfamily sulfate permease-like transporter